MPDRIRAQIIQYIRPPGLNKITVPPGMECLAMGIVLE